MKLGYLATMSYDPHRLSDEEGWPAPPQSFDPRVGMRSYAEGLEQARRADEVGFSMISVSEHHYSPGLMTPSPMVVAAALTQVVHQADIAILGPVMPLNNPVRVAEELATLDVLSEGRARVFFLRGTPNEWFTYPIDTDATRDVTRDGALLVRDALTAQQPLAWRGKHFDFPRIAVWPGVVQRPHPPMYFSGNSPESLEFAAHNRFGIALGFGADAQTTISRYRDLCSDAGWEPGPDHVVLRSATVVGETDEAALVRFAESIQRLGSPLAPRDPQVAEALAGNMPPVAQIETGQPGPLPHMPQPPLVGTPDTIIDAMHEYAAAGVGTLDLAFGAGGIDHETVLTTLTTYGERIIPAIRDLTPSW